MTVKFSKFVPVDYLDSSARIDDYLIVAKKEKDPILLEKAHETAERARKQLHHEAHVFWNENLGVSPIDSFEKRQ